jgi:hypothetical protein
VTSFFFFSISFFDISFFLKKNSFVVFFDSLPRLHIYYADLC